mmetsp:Transcript_54494/g.129449  ORF Transcript_54494/g.129449 Transcript_54494/m.129449 type:complete len:95 (-) Transcript_54494:94-378(-)
MFEHMREYHKLRSQLVTQKTAGEGANETPSDMPSGAFRDAVTDKVGIWGPILGGVVVVGGGLAVVGTLLPQNPGKAYYEPPKKHVWGGVKSLTG